MQNEFTLLRIAGFDQKSDIKTKIIYWAKTIGKFEIEYVEWCKRLFIYYEDDRCIYTEEFSVNDAINYIKSIEVILTAI